MRIFLSAPYAEWPTMQEYAHELRGHGHTISSTWHIGNDAGKDDGTTITASPAEQAVIAFGDLADLAQAQVYVGFPRSRGRGGTNVEYGYALALGKLLVVVGQQPTVFHHLPQVRFCETWEDAKATLNRLRGDAKRYEE